MGCEWIKVCENTNGATYYLDFTTIRKHDGYVYWWQLVDYLKPVNSGYLSTKVYNQGDCSLFRFKVLSGYWHKEPMGGGNGGIVNPKGDNKNWIYPQPNSVFEEILESVCAAAVD